MTKRSSAASVRSRRSYVGDMSTFYALHHPRNLHDEAASPHVPQHLMSFAYKAAATPALQHLIPISHKAAAQYLSQFRNEAASSFGKSATRLASQPLDHVRSCSHSRALVTTDSLTSEIYQ